MRKILIGVAAAALATASVVGMSGAAYAIPDNDNKEPVFYICDGVETEVFATGRSAWLNGEQYLAVSLEFTGTFTPADGGAPITETNTTTWDGGPKVDDPDDLILCTSHFDGPVPGGTLVGDGTATAVRVH